MKKALLFLVAFCTMFGAVKAQTENPVLPADEVQYWVGEGSNQVVINITWCFQSQKALAWGYRFDSDSVMLFEALTAIANADSRLTVVGAAPSNILYIEGSDTLTMCPNPDAEWGDDDYDVPMHSINGLWGQNGMASEPIGNGDTVKIGGYACAVTDATWTYLSWSTPVLPALVPGADATLTANHLQAWVGEGLNEAMMIVDWCNDGVALAWGYRFNKDSVTVATMLQEIAAADANFGYEGSFSWLTNLYYMNGADTAYQIVPDNISYNHNGGYANAADMEYIFPGDYVKFGGWMCSDYDTTTWISTWANRITPAPALPEVGPSDEVFDGAVGTEGCQAIRYNDPAILGWATTCTINRGLQNAAEPSVYASFGSEENAIGAIDTINSMNVVSLGDYGTAVLTFDVPIQNGEGYDFAVFENGFDATFLELAFVEVSSDGINYFRFPAISNTPTDEQVGPYGTLDCSKLNNLAGKYQAGWGTPFDLEDLPDDTLLDKNNITHVKLVDVVGSINPRYATRDSRGHIINDPYPNNVQGGGEKSGFDLDGVCVMNGWRPAAVQEYVENSRLNVYPNPCNTQVTVETVIGEPVMLFNSVGTLVYRTNANDTTMTLNMSDYSAGLYIVKCGNRAARIVKM